MFSIFEAHFEAPEPWEPPGLLMLKFLYMDKNASHENCLLRSFFLGDSVCGSLCLTAANNYFQ